MVARLGLIVEQQLIVQPKLALGRAGEVALDQDGSRYVGAEDGALGGHHQVAILHHVDKQLVLAVPDSLLTPADRAGRLDRDGLRRGFVCRCRAVALLRGVRRRIERVTVFVFSSVSVCSGGRERKCVGKRE